MVLAERIPNGLVIDVGERLKRLHDRRADGRLPGVEGAMRLSASRNLPDAIVGHQRQRAVDIVSVSRLQKAIHKCVVIGRHLSISRKQSARYCASADKLGNGAGNGFGLLQQQKVSRTRQVDNPDALAELLAERVTIARRSRCIIKPLDHEERRCSGAPPLFERHTAAGREVGEKHRRPTFDLRQYFRIGRR